MNPSLGLFVIVGSKVMGEDRKGRGCTELYVMEMNVLKLCSNFMLVVEKLYSLSSLVPH